LDSEQHKKEKTMKKIFFPLTLLVILTGCELQVIDNPQSLTVAQSQTVEGAYLCVTGGLKQTFEAHQQIGWTAGMIGNEEIQTLTASGSFLFANQLESEGKLAANNTQNRTIVSAAYTALSLADNASKGAQLITSTAGKALYAANIALIQGIIYGDLSKYFVQVPEYGTGTNLSPVQARDKAIAQLQTAITQFGAIPAGTTDYGAKTTGMFTDAAVAIKFCNSYIGMLLYDSGAKVQAKDFLQKGYVKADAGRELAYKNQNTLTGDGIYPAQRNYIEFSVNRYSDKFVNNRIVADTLRRVPARWFVSATTVAALRSVMSYFYPQGPVSPNPAGSGVLAFYPMITWQEVTLMLGDPVVGGVLTPDALSEVLLSWRIPAATVANLVKDPTVTLDRVARYEYPGRGRRWSAVGTYTKWDLANEFSFK
jgi:hypothetical protein